MIPGGMRVVVGISGSHHELLDDLETLPIRERAERIRTLATIGLMTARGTVEMRDGMPGSRSVCRDNRPRLWEQTPKQEPPVASEKARDFARKIGGF